MNNIDLKNKIAIVTGGAQGFGLATSKRLIESGATVIIWDIDKQEAEKAKNSLNSKKFSYQIVDVTNFTEVDANIKEIEKLHKKIDIFVNNAGMTGKNAKVWEYPVDEWKKVMKLNLDGTYYCCKAVVPIMIKNNYGRIVNIASIAGKEGNPKMVPYSSTKAAVIGLTKSVGKELAGTGIVANCITPAVVQTRILEEFTPEVIEYMVGKIPIGRTAEVSEIAALVAWLSSSECSFSTGAVFDISGGRATY